MNLTKIGNFEAIALLIVVSINHLLLNLPQTIIDTCGSASLLNIIYTTILAFILTYIIIFLLFKNFPSSNILDVAHYLGGKIFKNIIGYTCIIYLLILSSIFLRNFAEGLKLIYFFDAPITYILLFFLFVCAIANFFGPKAIIRTNLFIVPIVIIGMVIIFIFTIPYIKIERIFPILGYGAKETFFIGISNIFTFNGFFLIFFLRPLLSQTGKLKKITVISIIITAILVLMVVGSLLLAFPFIFSIQEISPIYFIIRNIEFGRFFQRPEALFILTWIFGVMSYLNCILFIVLKLFKDLTNVKSIKNLSFPFTCIILFLALIPKDMAQIRLFEDVIYKYGSIILTVFILTLVLIIANIKYMIKRKYESLEVNFKNE